MGGSDFSRTGRRAAAVVATAAWLGLCCQILASAQASGGVAQALVAMSRYFTVLTNLAVAVVFTGVAVGLRVGAGWTAGAALCISLVGVVYHLLLGGSPVLPGPGVAANMLMHTVAPVLAAVVWLTLAPKGRLRRGHPWLWLGVLGAYFAYALSRGAIEGRAVYPFMDAPRLGWQGVARTNLVIGIAFLTAAFAMVALDGWLARRTLAPA